RHRVRRVFIDRRRRSGSVAGVARRAVGILGTGGVRVRVRRDLWLRERDGVAITAGGGDRLGQLVRRHHALVDRDVGDLVARMDVDADDVWVLTQTLLDAGGAAFAGERPRGNRERHLPMVSMSVRRSAWSGRSHALVVVVSVVRWAGHVRIPSPERTV